MTILTVVLILSGSTIIKIYLNAQGELNQAQQRVAENELEEAVTHYERSLQWFVPALDLQEKAAQGLWDIGETYETKGEEKKALNTFRRLRGAFYSVRSFYTPGVKWITRCNEKIATLMARMPATTEKEKEKTFEQRKTEYRALLASQQPPYSKWALVSEIGFFGWVTCTLFFIFRAMTQSGDLRPRPALFWMTGFVVFYSLWILGLFWV
ncbi:MAG: hypothetical protein GWN72_08335 [Nitrospinaceae bacterium]|nr:hypothetical protein [Nitrospinaceae bacterium]NIU96378.1 hypothetical protein [Nitrospinaceae bacterium]NIW59013.1 hypothetical protein [Nitrospinaceae bacterium]